MALNPTKKDQYQPNVIALMQYGRPQSSVLRTVKGSHKSVLTNKIIAFLSSSSSSAFLNT